MSDRSRSQEEIERQIARRQGELSDDLEELEYRLSRRGMKDEARERVAETRDEMLERASRSRDRLMQRTSELGGQAGERIRSLSSRTGWQVSSWQRELSELADRNPLAATFIFGGAAAGVGALIAHLTWED
jgi:DNA repair exonuclease SbcCD ATPase subunit